MNLALVKGHLENAFRRFGTSRDAKSAPPSSMDNRAGLAWEYFVADQLCSLADKRKKLAKKACEEAGILSKPAVGSTEVVYNNETLQIVAQTKSPASRIDRTLLHSALMKRYGHAAAEEVINEATKQDSPATTFSFVGATQEEQEDA